MVRFLAHWLIILAAWTLVIKFVFPLSYDAFYGHPAGTHLMWDFWWVIHLILAWALLQWRQWTWWFAVVVSVIEIAIITVKFAFFLRAPEWNIWQTNWFVNKVFVLACFIVLLVVMLRNRQNIQAGLSVQH